MEVALKILGIIAALHVLPFAVGILSIFLECLARLIFSPSSNQNAQERN